MPETRKYTVVDLFAGVGGLSYGFCEDESFSCSEKPDFVMIVYSANNDSRHRRKIYIYKDIIEPLIMSVEFLNKEIKKQNHGTVTPDT